MSMLRVLSCVALLVPAASSAQSVFGRYSMPNGQGGKVVVTLAAAAAGKVKGTLAGNGQSFTIEGQMDEGDVTGMLRGPGGSAIFEAALEGAALTVILIELDANGQPNYASARELTFTRDDAAVADQQGGGATGAAGAPAPSGATGIAGSGPQDKQLSQLLLGSAWCSFSYKGGSTYSGGSYGRTTTTRAVFQASGVMQMTTGSESSNSGSAGSVYGSNSSGETYRWRVDNGALLLSGDGVQWQTVRLEVQRNSNGYPIVKADGVEYMQCR